PHAPPGKGAAGRLRLPLQRGYRRGGPPVRDAGGAASSRLTRAALPLPPGRRRGPPRDALRLSRRAAGHPNGAAPPRPGARAGVAAPAPISTGGRRFQAAAHVPALDGAGTGRGGPGDLEAGAGRRAAAAPGHAHRAARPAPRAHRAQLPQLGGRRRGHRRAPDDRSRGSGPLRLCPLPSRDERRLPAHTAPGHLRGLRVVAGVPDGSPFDGAPEQDALAPAARFLKTYRGRNAKAWASAPVASCSTGRPWAMTMRRGCQASSVWMLAASARRSRMVVLNSREGPN